ncbi:glycosyltransferase [Oceanimonas smirnovii]|uniref:glycosyltransferase n=1 Tax=Oceanimonas smirnovii TaxID=264574 RepID=UPI003AB02765
MKKHNFVTIIYSVLTKTSGWKIGKEISFEEYREKLFDTERLKKREEIFERITLPSLSSFSKNSTVLIFISNELPTYFKQRLLKLIEPYNYIKLVEINVDEHVFIKVGSTVKDELEKMGEDVLYSTIRLDDDDAVSKKFMNTLEPYLDTKFIGVCITFSSGVGLIFDNEKILSAHLKKAPKIAIGLAWINRFNSKERTFDSKYISVYNLGNHISVEERVPTLIDPREISWARSIHDISDIYSSHLVNTYKSQPEIKLSSLSKYFDIKI